MIQGNDPAEKRWVSLEEAMRSREMRAARQRENTEKYRRVQICFTMCIPGPVKVNDLIIRGFEEGRSLIMQELKLAKIPVLTAREIREKTGPEYDVVLDTKDAKEIKMCMTDIEERCPIGRLFDLDVLDVEGKKLERESLGNRTRGCLICGREGKNCARSRAHSVEELWEKTMRMLREYFREKDAENIARSAQKALLYEVSVTPKPGLVDRNDRGSHEDMDYYTFLDSAVVLYRYFKKCALIGMEQDPRETEETFLRLQYEGKCAETDMYQTTKDVNTHKGAIYSLGLLCAGAGIVKAGGYGDGYQKEGIQHTPASDTAEIQKRAKKICEAAGKIARSSGEETRGRFCDTYGMKGARGEACRDFETVRTVALPALLHYLEQYGERETLLQGSESIWEQKAWDSPKDYAGAMTLMGLMACTQDTNLAARGGEYAVSQEQARIRRMLNRPQPLTRGEIEVCNLDYIRRGLSPGGSADLLAAAWFLWNIT